MPSLMSHIGGDTVVCSRDMPEQHIARLHEMVFSSISRAFTVVFVIILPSLMAWLFNLVIDVFNLVILTQMTKLKVD